MIPLEESTKGIQSGVFHNIQNLLIDPKDSKYSKAFSANPALISVTYKKVDTLLVMKAIQSLEYKE